MQSPVSSVAAPAYAAARAVASRVHDHFIRHVEAARAQTADRPVPLPGAPTIEAVIDAAFWASLLREEGYVPRISLALLTAGRAAQPLVFEQPLPLSPGVLARLAPAVERPGIHLGVWQERGELYVWGTTREVPAFCVVLEVVAPGLLVVKHRRSGDAGKFVNVVVLEGHQIKIVNERASDLPDCPALLASLLGGDAPASWL